MKSGVLNELNQASYVVNSKKKIRFNRGINISLKTLIKGVKIYG